MKIIKFGNKFLLEVKQKGLGSAVKKTRKFYHKKRKERYINQQSSKDCGAINHYPLVSLIAVNFNGESDLPIFLDTINKQSYTNFELIIVDNNSTDNSAQIIQDYQKKFNNITFLQSGSNLGFAAGNNFAMPYCKGEFYGLINIDTRVDENWLKELVDAISLDGTCGAICSKTLFFEKFQDIEFNTTNEFKIDIKHFVNTLGYKKYFLRHGYNDSDFIYSNENKVVLSLPVQDESIAFEITGLTEHELLFTKIGKKEHVQHIIDSSCFNIKIDFSHSATVNPSYIINNAGSISHNGMPADRGIGEYDTGQYDKKQYVDFFCGVSVLLRRSVIVDRKIFVSEFFAYYEDSELSRHIRALGYKILYAPRSVLYHQHSATSSEGSPLWNLLVSRSQKIYNYESDPTHLIEEVDQLEEKYKPDINQSVYNELKKFSHMLSDRLSKDDDIVERLKPIAIYNSYWNTKGGGESHALSFANILQKHDTIYLVSETDFSIEELSRYYNIDLSNCRKLVQSNISTDFTKRFNIFINSTYSSNLISSSKHSYYIVSFPHKQVTQKFLNGYTFVYNSKYTKRWAEAYWGKDIRSEIVYPIGSVHKNKVLPAEKERIILNVGRFFVGHHCKNQLEIAKAFKQFSKHQKDDDWQLVLIGSIDASDADTMEYFRSIKRELEGLNYKIITNASRDVLNDYYKRSYIYVHAAGLGRDAQKNPDQFEHFGITPVEAMTFGCIPIVYTVGGPAELIQTLQIGYTFDNEETLGQKISEISNTYDNTDSEEVNSVLSSINNFLDDNQFAKRLQFIIRDNDD